MTRRRLALILAVCSLALVQTAPLFAQRRDAAEQARRKQIADRDRELYKLGPDSQRQDGVPQGAVTQHKWETSKVFPGTTRDYWVYVPKQYDAAKPACVMVFQDGKSYADEKGD